MWLDHLGYLLTCSSACLDDPARAWCCESASAAPQASRLLHANAKLTPENPGVDILTDISASWTWLHAHLPSAIPDPRGGRRRKRGRLTDAAVRADLQRHGPPARRRCAVPGYVPRPAGVATRPAAPDAGLEEVVAGY